MADVPPVSYPVGRSAALAGVLALPLLLAAALAAWACFDAKAGAHIGPTAIVLIVSVALAVAAACHFWRRQPLRTLHWDGSEWRLGEGTAAAAGDASAAATCVQVRADAQRWLLLWYPAAGDRRGQWLWAQASSDPARWHLLRSALYSPQPSAGGPGAAATDAERA